MNKIEKEMIEILKRLKNDYGVIEIKAEYENEGSRQDELMRLKDVSSKVDLPIIIKIGGVQAISDIYNAITLGVSGIIAPMAETKFAVSKFTNSIETFVAEDNKEDIEFAFNIETITGYSNLDDILTLNNLDILQGMTIGRVDFTASMGKDRTFVDSKQMLEYCIEIFRKSKSKGLKCGLGGAISSNSKEFIQTLVSKNLIDKYETRKIVYDKDAINRFDKGILAGVEFELLWLKSKRRYYHRIKIEDEKRIEMLEKRLNS
ncbi:aldolase/citrate lyase family protein [Aliarcobacter butzleri]|uniref:Aldolase/citrate lyase family protein n=1 Tax=Aliarcobacter butzleri TaxID=28197 RepID=A0AAP4PYD7_9BACT|nr:aldolase/citrate lyase family protein [Aliarcobacter butzleri]MCT7556230.1 aldolase/citrate lyase family protein [Aliarcobacter butzleri]MCT7593286.1 aldolase/citrate lyase family protein [Aliarcobacter butzleri]MCT7597952.1 aldolase/citrate lyase family protein [Aliarcobacter butzleri]MDN5051959.1 aldolase/citrate lyase family protein [Aliarcobacter butzleri]MDN5074654.1 aldolase/citrate lyase family protein [Aliarcobacter butzleri]